MCAISMRVFIIFFPIVKFSAIVIGKLIHVQTGNTKGQIISKGLL